MMDITRDKSAQTVLEYVIFVGIVAIVIIAMAPMIKRGFQSVVQVTADQIGDQKDAEQNFGAGGGYLINQVSTVRSSVSKEKNERPDYQTQFVYNDTMVVTTETLTNLGFTEDN